MRPSPEPRGNITAAVLAGGRGTRMNGVDKGLVSLAGRPMVEYVLQALRPQVARLLINANRSLETYAGYGVPVVPDRESGFAGPLAGVEAVLAAAQTPWVVTVPCDGPLVPPDLVDRLASALEATPAADIAAAHDGERLQPVYALIPTDLLDDLTAFLGAGERKVNRWLEGHRLAVADFSDRTEAFVNVNRPDDSRRVLAALAGRTGGPA